MSGRTFDDADAPPAPNNGRGASAGQRETMQFFAEKDPSKANEGGPVRSQGSVLVDLAFETGMELFFDDEETCYARVEIEATASLGAHLETYRVGSAQFNRWLTNLYFEKRQKAVGRGGISDAANTIAAQAQRLGVERKVFTRLGEQAGATYLNLCDPGWHVVKITPEGWEVQAKSDAYCIRPKGMLALPIPERGGSIDELRPLVNLDDEEWILLVSWLIGTLSPKGPYPPAVLRGGQGSAKSTMARLLRRLVDPNKAPVRAEPKEERDLAISAKNGWVIVFDNLPQIQPWLSDALCRLATGGGYSVRSNYTDDEEALFDYQRPAVLTGIGEIVTRPDLLDRALLFQLLPLDDNRMSERDYWAQFAAIHGRVLGALLDAVVVGLRRLPEVHLPKPPRMADFAEWVSAAEPGLGWVPGTFMNAYGGNREEAQTVALSACPISSYLVRFVRGQEGGSWKGTSSELLNALNTMAEGSTKPPDWPKGPRSIAVQLQRIIPNLRVLEGIGYERPPRIDGRAFRLFVLPGTDANADANTETTDAKRKIGDANLFASAPVRGCDDANDVTDANSPFSLPSKGREGKVINDTDYGLGDIHAAGRGEFASVTSAEFRARVAAVLLQAEALGWPAIELHPGEWIGSKDAPIGWEAHWRLFVHNASVERLSRAEMVLALG